MKKQMMALLTAVLFVGAAAAQDQPVGPQDNGQRRGGGMRGMMRGGGAGMMMLRNPRAEAEAELSKKAPEDFAALVKERQAIEEKMQALAKKNEITLPDADFTRAEKMAAFNKKYEKELEEINAQMRTDPRGAMRKRMELMRKEGIDLGFSFGGGMRGGGQDMRKPAAPEAGPRKNMRAELEAQIKEKFPEEYAAYLKEKETDPRGAALKLRDLAKKLRENAPKPEKK